MPSALSDALDRLAAKFVTEHGEDLILAIVHQALAACDQVDSTLPPKALEPVLTPPDTASQDSKAMDRVIAEAERI